MTPRTRSWPATTGRRWRKYFSMLPAAGYRKAHPDRRGDSVGHPVSRAARLFDLVSRGDVGAQSRQPDDEPPDTDRVSDLADDHEPDPACDRRHSDDAARDDLFRFQYLRHRAAADRLLLQSDLHQLVAGIFVSGLVLRNDLGAEKIFWKLM